jgi:hypothetical protein
MALPRAPADAPRQNRRRKVPSTHTMVPGSIRATVSRVRARSVVHASESTLTVPRLRAGRSTTTVKEVITSPLGNSRVRIWEPKRPTMLTCDDVACAEFFFAALPCMGTPSPSFLGSNCVGIHVTKRWQAITRGNSQQGMKCQYTMRCGHSAERAVERTVDRTTRR